MRSLRLAPVFVAMVTAAASCTSILGDFSSGSGGGTDAGSNAEGGDSGGMTDGPQMGDTTNPGDTGGGDSPQGTDSGDAGGGDGGGGIVSCAIVTSEQRAVTAGDGGTFAADKLYVYNTSQTNVLALIKTSNVPSLAFQFRSDRPGDAPNIVPLEGPGGSPATLAASTRTVGNDATYVFGNDNQGNQLLWNWPDSMNINGNFTSAMEGFNYQATTMQATTAGVFYASAMNNGPTDGGLGGMGVYVDFPSAPPAQLPNVNSNDVISPTVDTGLGDGARIYRLSDDSISLLYYGSDLTLHQAHFAQNSTTPSSDRQYYTKPMQPVSWQPDGPGQVDVVAAVPVNEAGTEYTLATGVVPESQLFSFDPSTALQPISFGSPITTQPCLTSFPGKVIALVPDLMGMDLYVIDIATHKVTYSLTGSMTLLNSDTSIVTCALGNASFVGNQLNFELIWTDNIGNGQQTLNYAPLKCTTQ